jgi:hypothetical protein
MSNSASLLAKTMQRLLNQTTKEAYTLLIGITHASGSQINGLTILTGHNYPYYTGEWQDS